MPATNLQSIEHFLNSLSLRTAAILQAMHEVKHCTLRGDVPALRAQRKCQITVGLELRREKFEVH